ncbi:DUF983 domain-containing protein [Altererythrobacter arenosus]|uniref:DUF983 domain-containing protein n=1 Tax=Altererythrobacter arenosus TaxID=3032592 RepID=A0ABY8FS47_9SPHN|nr:DUF983 domain-containing protein [Altererythrobacter sp. CAU 1644]WFL77587.1 DUF983 domain-containing protein [Altererythrobacter sp. CAU 1644]
MTADGGPPIEKGQPGIPQAALFGLCPKCGSRTLFDGAAKFADRCRVCGLDLTRFNVGDGPAAFLTLIIGAIIVALALWLDATVRPPFWVHALIWIPVTAGAVLWGLRVSKAWLLQAEHRNNAGEAGSKDL